MRNEVNHFVKCLPDSCYDDGFYDIIYTYLHTFLSSKCSYRVQTIHLPHRSTEHVSFFFGFVFPLLKRVMVCILSLVKCFSAAVVDATRYAQSCSYIVYFSSVENVLHTFPDSTYTVPHRI